MIAWIWRWQAKRKRARDEARAREQLKLIVAQGIIAGDVLQTLGPLPMFAATMAAFGDGMIWNCDVDHAALIEAGLRMDIQPQANGRLAINFVKVA